MHGTLQFMWHFPVLLFFINVLVIEEVAAGQQSEMSEDRLLMKRKRLLSQEQNDHFSAYLQEDNSFRTSRRQLHYLLKIPYSDIKGS